MSANSKIEWTEATWSVVTGCTRVSSGCDQCYAVRMSHRLENMGQEKYRGLTVLNGKGDRHFNGTVKLHESELQTPLRRRKPTTYFVCSMSDLFHRDVPFEFIDRVFAVMALCPQHTFQVLTKRPERAAEYLGRLTETRLASEVRAIVGRRACTVIEEDDDPRSTENVMVRFRDGWLPNVWLGTSIENQATADERIPHLLKCPAVVRFISAEPLLGPVDLFESISAIQRRLGVGYVEASRIKHAGKIDWIIVGGESGPRARPTDVVWIRSIVAQCKAAGVPCFVKQLGARPIQPDGLIIGNRERLPLVSAKGGNWDEWPEDLRVRELPAKGREA